MKILLISYFFPPDKSVGGLRAASITKYFPKTGIEVVLLTSQTDLEKAKEIREQFNVKELFTAKRSKLRYWGYKTKILSILELLNLDKLLVFPDIYFPWIRRAVKEGRKAIKQTNPDCILVTAPPFSTFIVADKLSQEFDLPLILDYRDPWNGNPTIKYPLKRVQRRYLKAERRIAKRAKMITTVVEDCATIIVLNTSIPKEQMNIIYNGFSYTYTEHANIQKSNKLKIFYSGSIHSIYKNSFINFLKALSGLIEEKNLTPEDICFTYAGSSSRKVIMRRLENSNLLPFFEDLGYLHGEEYFEQIQKASLHLVFAPEEIKYALATKIYDYMQVDSHFLIIGKHGAVDRVCEQVGQHFTLVNDERLDLILSSMKGLYENWRNNDLIYGSNRDLVNNFSREVQTTKYAELIKEKIGSLYE